jgi:DNA modification methylase
MGIMQQEITDKYAIYNADCIEAMKDIKSESIHFSIYSPPFASMYTYSSDIRDLGNNKIYEEFLINYEYVVKEISRLTMPGRMTAVHCMDIPKNGDMGLDNFPGDIIELHKKNGFKYWDRKNIWKEPLRVAIRTRQRALMHMQLVNDTAKCRGALADYLLIFKKNGENKIPIEKPYGLTQYDGDLELMNKIELEEYLSLKEKYVNYKDDKTNRLSQFIWRRYASSAWEDIRANRALCYKPARDKDDDRHVCPLQLDIVTRSVQLYTNKKEIVFTPFMGVGTEVYGAIINDRMGIGIELKPSYYNQALKNLKDAQPEKDSMSQMELL